PAPTPGATRFDAARYAALTGHPSGSDLAPLKPDLVGEYFVLRLLRPHDDLDDRAERLWREAGRLNPVAAFSFVEQCAADYAGHPTLPHLGALLAQNADQRMVSAMDMFFRQSQLAAHQGIDAVIDRWRELTAAAQRNAGEP